MDKKRLRGGSWRCDCMEVDLVSSPVEMGLAIFLFDQVY